MDNKERFTGKVSEYVKYRPIYPQTFIDYLTQNVGIAKDSIVADIGAGTGILTKQLGVNVKTVIAVEPNFQMRMACENYCDDLDNLVTINGCAEDTKLLGNSVDFITVAQAFHWFDRDQTKFEFQRILKPNGKVILVWNIRTSESEFVKENEGVCRHFCPEFRGFAGGNDPNRADYSDFFKNGYYDSQVFDNDQLLTLESYIGGSLSASYAPSMYDRNYQKFVDALSKLFQKYSMNNQLLLPMKTYSYVGEV